MVSSAQPVMAMLDLLGPKQPPSNKPKLSTPQDSHKVRFCLQESHCFSYPPPGVNYLGQELVVLVSPKQPATDQSRHAGCPAVPACVTPPSAPSHVLSAHRVVSGREFTVPRLHKQPWETDAAVPSLCGGRSQGWRATEPSQEATRELPKGTERQAANSKMPS